VLIQANFFNLALMGLEKLQIIKYSIYQTAPLLTYVLIGYFSFVFLYTVDGQQCSVVLCHNIGSGVRNVICCTL
jgi:hypothetical protein